MPHGRSDCELDQERTCDSHNNPLHHSEALDHEHRSHRRGDHQKKEWPRMTFLQAHDCYRKAVDHHMYQLQDRSSTYVEDVANGVVKWMTRLEIQMRSNI